MCKFSKNLLNLQEDEIVKILYSNELNYSDNLNIQRLITKGYISKNMDFKLHVTDFLKSDPSKCINFLQRWNIENNKLDYSTLPSIQIDKFKIEGCKNFLEICMSRFNLSNLDLILDYLDSEDYNFKLCCLRSSIIIIYENFNKIIKEQLDGYLDFIIDFCINHIDDKLVKLEVIKLLGKMGSSKGVPILEYLRDNDSDFTVKITSMMGLDSIRRLSMKNSSKDNSNIKKILLNYRR